jgi:CRISPR-associated exonuclease Cas4
VEADLHGDRMATAPLYDPKLHLSGRPDLLLRRSEGLIPVESKSMAAPPRPYEGHLIQLAAYCRLVDTTYARRPPYGLLRYADRTFAIAWDSHLEGKLERQVRKARLAAGFLPDRSHRSAARCRACGFSAICDQRLP